MKFLLFKIYIFPIIRCEMNSLKTNKEVIWIFVSWDEIIVEFVIAMLNKYFQVVIKLYMKLFEHFYVLTILLVQFTYNI